jgi:regulator of replication initiation timing
MEYTLTKKDVAKLLERTPKSVSRYVKLKQLHPTLVKRGRYQKYMFNIDEVKRFKVSLQEGTLGGKQEGTLEGTSVNTPTPDKQPSVNNLHGVQEGTQEGKQDRKQEGTKDSTKGEDELVKTLNRVIDILEKQVVNTSKVVENQSRQIDEIMVQQRFLLNENTAFRKQLGLPTVKDDVNNGSYSEVVKEVVEVVKEQEEKQGGKQEGKVGGTNKQPKQPKQPSKKSKGKGKNKSSSKESKRVNKDGNKGVQEQVKQPKNNPITSGKTAQPQESKKENRDRFNLFKWIFK